MKTFTDKSWDSDGKYVEKYSDFLDRLFTLPMSLDDPIVVEDRNDIVQTCIDEIEELRDTMVEENEQYLVRVNVIQLHIWVRI